MKDEVNHKLLSENCVVLVDNNLPRASFDHGVFFYNMEESLAENMYNLSMEAAITDDDVDINPSPSSRPPTEPFGIDNYSEDDPSEMPNMTTLAGIASMIEKHNTEYPDVRALMKCVDPGYIKYGTILAELEKWSYSTDDYIEENPYTGIDADSSYKP